MDTNHGGDFDGNDPSAVNAATASYIRVAEGDGDEVADRDALADILATLDRYAGSDGHPRRPRPAHRETLK